MAAESQDGYHSRLEAASSRLTRIVGSMCPPAMRCLRTMGYEQALVVRGWTHLALWFSALVSFTFSIVWLSDVIQWRCAEQNAAIQHPTFLSKLTCLWETLGMIIFFASFRDSVRMIAHYDDHKQAVLKEKWRILEALKVESKQVLEAAKKNIDNLRGEVVETIEEQVSYYAKEVFTIILPDLNTLSRSEDLDALRRAELEEQVKKFVGHCRLTLVEVEELAIMMLKDLAVDHPDVLQRTLSDESYQCGQGHDHKAKLLWVMNIREHRENTTKGPSASPGYYMNVWDGWIECDYPAFAGPRPDAITPQEILKGLGNPSDGVQMNQFGLEIPVQITMPMLGRRSVSAPATCGEEELESKKEKTCPEQNRLADKLAHSVLQPVEELLSMPDKLGHQQDKVEARARDKGLMSDGKKTVEEEQREKEQRAKRKKRCGCGVPPWGGAGCSLVPCIPYVVAALTRIVCICIWRPCCNGLCARGLTWTEPYGPKRLQFGCFWMQIHTKLHERLIQSLLFSLAFFVLYCFIIKEMLESFEDKCGGSFGFLSSTACIGTLARKSIAAVAMLFYIPALACCLYRIDRLDAVMETIETIWELEDIQRAVRAFDTSMQQVGEQVILLKAIKERVLTRIHIITTFGRKTGGMMSKHPAAKSGALDTLIKFLDNLATELKTVESWLQMSNREKDALAIRVQHSISDIKESEFGLNRKPEQRRGSNGGSAVPPQHIEMEMQQTYSQDAQSFGAYDSYVHDSHPLADRTRYDSGSVTLAEMPAALRITATHSKGGMCSSKESGFLDDCDDMATDTFQGPSDMPDATF